jgi:hypothetical protein
MNPPISRMSPCSGAADFLDAVAVASRRELDECQRYQSSDSSRHPNQRKHTNEYEEFDEKH